MDTKRHRPGGMVAGRTGNHYDQQRGKYRDTGFHTCLLYTSDAADERSSVDLGGRRIIKKKHNRKQGRRRTCKIHKDTAQYN